MEPRVGERASRGRPADGRRERTDDGAGQDRERGEALERRVDGVVPEEGGEAEERGRWPRAVGEERGAGRRGEHDEAERRAHADAGQQGSGASRVRSMSASRSRSSTSLSAAAAAARRKVPASVAARGARSSREAARKPVAAERVERSEIAELREGGEVRRARRPRSLQRLEPRDHVLDLGVGERLRWHRVGVALHHVGARLAGWSAPGRARRRRTVLPLSSVSDLPQSPLKVGPTSSRAVLAVAAGAALRPSASALPRATGSARGAASRGGPRPRPAARSSGSRPRRRRARAGTTWAFESM